MIEEINSENGENRVPTYIYLDFACFWKNSFVLEHSNYGNLPKKSTYNGQNSNL